MFLKKEFDKCRFRIAYLPGDSVGQQNKGFPSDIPQFSRLSFKKLIFSAEIGLLLNMSKRTLHSFNS